MHRLLGNRWSLIAGRIPGRTANDIKNYFNTQLRKMLEPQPKEEEEEEESVEEQKAERHRVIRPIPRFPTTVIGSVIRPVPRFPTTVIATGGPLIVSENRHHKLHHRQLPAPHEENDEHTISGNQQHQLHPEQLLPLAEQNDDPVIHNDEHSVWWNDTFKFLELEGVEYMNQNPGFITNAGESSTNAGTGTEGKGTTMFYDGNTEWRHLLEHDLLDGA